uniref:RNA-dependent RNA polymerase n=1 Tax=Shrew picobirnavirus 3 TaxID=3139562 RepID=A0AB38ZJT3_9VIRU
MFPFSTNLVEGSFMQPLQKALISTEHRYSDGFFAPWRGFSKVRDRVSTYYADPEISIAASDFTETDIHFRLPATLEVYSVIKHCFQKKYHDDLLQSLTHMHTIPLVVGENEIVYGSHGVSSGSVYTNFIETIYGKIYATYVHLLFLNTFGLYGIGDDLA